MRPSGAAARLLSAVKHSGARRRRTRRALAAKALGDDIGLRRIRRGSPPAWRGAPRRKSRFSAASSAPSAPPWNTLATKAPPGLRTVAAKANAVLGQRDDAQMVGRGMAGRRRRHVAEHQVGRAAERASQLRPARPASRKSPGSTWRRRSGRSAAGRCRRPGPLGARRARPRSGVQPPGAQPRSTTRRPGFSRRNCSSSWISLKAARER